MEKPKGNQISFIEENGKKIKVMNWHGFNVEIGAYKSPFFFNEIQKRRNRAKSNIIAITGSPGDGKTYCAIRLAEVFDKKFNPTLQIVFTRPQLLHLIGEETSLKRGQVIIIDEAHYGMGSRRWMESVQKDLMDALASVRSRGFIIMIVCLHLAMLDIIIRRYVLNFMIHLEDRGKGVVYRLYTPRFAKELYKTRMGIIRLALPDAEKCNYSNCLPCEHRSWCGTTRAIYERNKKAFIDETSKQAEERALNRAKKDKRMSVEASSEILLDNWDELETNNRGNIDSITAYVVLKRVTGEVHGSTKLRLICKMAEFKKSKKFQKKD